MLIRYFCSRILDLRISHSDKECERVHKSLNDYLIELIVLRYFPYTSKWVEKEGLRSRSLVMVVDVSSERTILYCRIGFPPIVSL